MKPCNGSVLVEEPRGENDLITWTKHLLETMGVNPPVQIYQPNTSLFQVQHRYNEKDIFFFSNQDKEKSVQFSAGFNYTNGIPWRWDPETGKREVYHYGKDPKNFNIELDPMESLLLVFEKRKGPQADSAHLDESEYMSIDTPWKIQCFHHTGSEFQLQISELVDLGSSED